MGNVWQIDNNEDTAYVNIGEECILFVKKVDDGIELRTMQKQKDGKTCIVFSRFISIGQLC